MLVVKPAHTFGQGFELTLSSIGKRKHINPFLHLDRADLALTLSPIGRRKHINLPLQIQI